MGNVVSPESLVEAYGTDATRYFLMREVPFGLDGNFSQSAMRTRINSDLANDLGNLLSRATGMVVRFSDGILPEAAEDDDIDKELIKKADWLHTAYTDAMNNLEFHNALIALWEFISQANKYVDKTKPWQEAKSGNKAILGTRLYNIIEATRIASTYLVPFMPDTAGKILSAISQDIKGYNLDRLSAWGFSAAGVKINQASPLFKKQVDIKKQDAERQNGANKKPIHPLQPSEQITLDQFKTVELKVGKILSANRVEGSQKLIKLEIDMGEQRTVVGGIGKSYTPEELIGKYVVVVANLKPITLFGIQSQGMLLAAGDAEHLSLLTMDRDAAAGTRIK